jgi:hypothetical protein
LEASGIGAPSASPAPSGAALEARRAHGRLSDGELRQLRSGAWRDVIRPTLDALLATAGHASAAPLEAHA